MPETALDAHGGCQQYLGSKLTVVEVGLKELAENRGRGHPLLATYCT